MKSELYHGEDNAWSMVCNHCKNLLEETYICIPFESLLNVTALLVRLAQTITKYLGIKKEITVIYLHTLQCVVHLLLVAPSWGTSPYSWLRMWGIYEIIHTWTAVVDHSSLSVD